MFKFLESDDGVLHAILFSLALALLWVCAGCTIGETGSRTVVGNHFALPTLSSAGDEVDIKIYESVEGAVITTRKDSLVEIAYLNSYTNNICGLWDKVGEMKLTVKVEPLAVEIASATPRNDEESTTPRNDEEAQ